MTSVCIATLARLALTTVCIACCIATLAPLALTTVRITCCIATLARLALTTVRITCCITTLTLTFTHATHSSHLIGVLVYIPQLCRFDPRRASPLRHALLLLTVHPVLVPACADVAYAVAFDPYRTRSLRAYRTFVLACELPLCTICIYIAKRATVNPK